MEIRRMEVSGSSATRAVGKVGILLADSANPFWRSKVEEYLRQAPDWGFEIVFREGRDPRDPERQAEALRAMYGEGCDALVLNPLTSDNLVPALGDAPAPILDVGPKCDPVLVRDIARYHPIRVSDFEEQGVLAAEAVLSGLSSPGEG